MREKTKNSYAGLFSVTGSYVGIFCYIKSPVRQNPEAFYMYCLSGLS